MIKSRLLQEQKLREDDMFSWLRGKAVRDSNQSHYNQQSFSISIQYLLTKSLILSTRYLLSWYAYEWVQEPSWAIRAQVLCITDRVILNKHLK